MIQDESGDISFEQAFQRLEESVQALERGGHTLEQSVALYEEGMRMAMVCTARLDQAQLKVTELQTAFLNHPPTNEDDEYDR